jgi:hypothetical protein
MANNTTLPGTGETIAAEELGGVKYQQLKLIDATPGSTTPVGTDANPLVATMRDMNTSLQRLMEIIANPLAVDPTTSRMRVSIEAGGVSVSSLPTLAAVTTVATVTNLAQIGAVNANQVVMDIADTSWAEALRDRIV